MRTGRGPPAAPRRRGARRVRAPRPPSTPGRWPSTSTAVVPSWIVTPRSSRTRRRPRASVAGWTVAAPGMKTPSRNTGESTLARTSSAVSGTRRSPRPWSRRASHGRQPAIVLGRRGARLERTGLHVPRVHAVRGAERPDLVDSGLHRVTHSDGAGHAVAVDQRRELVPPIRGEPAVPPRRPTAADVGLDEHDPRPRLQLGQPQRRPQTRVPATDDRDVGRGRAT